MRLTIPPDQTARLCAALKAAGSREIGGQLFGEQRAPSDFAVTDLTIQPRGTFARFMVDLVQAARDALAFFERTERRYTRFNYVGEWHSHPSFAVQPSTVDVAAMRQLVGDPSFKGNFAVLMITRLDAEQLIYGAWVFDRGGRTASIQLEIS
jgi:hypothetical protein